MNMKMKMKNNKTMLALVLVAALALCSVGVVAAAENSNAATSTVLTDKDVFIDEDTNGANFNVYVPFTQYGNISATSIDVKIISTANYSGTIQFGTYDAVAEKYTPMITLALENVNSALITFSAVNGTLKDCAVISTITDSYSVTSTTGTITVSAGAVKLGDSSYFSGTVIGNTATLVSENTYGAILKSGTTDSITGTVLAGTQQYYTSWYATETATKETKGYKTVDSKLTVDGKANVSDDMVIGSDSNAVGEFVQFVIAETASVVLPADSITYKITSASTVKLTLSLKGAASSNITGAVYDNFGQIVATASCTTADKVIFTVKENMSFDMTKTYSLFLAMSVTDNSNVKFFYYSGTISFAVSEYIGVTEAATEAKAMIAKANVSGSTTASAATINKDAKIAADKDIAGVMSSTTALAYNSSKYVLVYAIAGATNGTDVTGSGSITFGSNISTDSATAIVLKNKATGAYVVFAGKISSAGVVATASTVTYSAIKAVSTLGANNGEIVTGAIVASNATADIFAKNSKTGDSAIVVKDSLSTLDDDDKTVTLTVSGSREPTTTYTYKNTLTVEGELKAYYASSDSNGLITVNGIADVNGSISQQMAKSTTYTAPITNVNAAAYKVSAATDSTQVYDTYYYTTLKNAMSAAANIYTYGTIVLLEDTTLTGTPVGAVDTENNVTIVGTLVVGQAASLAIKALPETPAIPAKEAITVIVTVPITTKLVTDGNVNVANGQLKIEGLNNDSGYNVIAAVFMTDETYGIYTDLATALGLAVSGDEISVRPGVTTASFSKDVELKDGVKLDANAVTITVKSGVTFTITGIISVSGIIVEPSVAATTSTPAKTAGTLVLAKYNADSVITTITLSGIVTVGSGFDNSADDAVAIGTALVIKDTSKKVPAIVNVLGKAKYAGTVSGAVTSGTVSGYINGNISGAFIFSGTFDGSLSDVVFVADISGELSVKSNFYVSEATVTGKVAVDDGVKFFVKSFIIIGKAPTDAKTSTNSAEVFATLENDNAYAIVYGTPVKDKIFVNDAHGVAVTSATAYYLNTDVLFATGYAIEGKVAISKIADPVITGNAFYGWYLEPTFQTPIGSKVIGAEDAEKVYGKLVVKTFNVTFSHVQNGQWTINGQSVDGISIVPYNANGYDVQFNANSGYELKNVEIMVNGHAMPTNYVPADDDVFTITGEVVEKSSNGGMDLVTILLIIITIVIIIMAIIIALKLLRS